MTEKNKIGNVLFLDDEPNILRSIKRTFFHAEFNVFIASNVQDAFTILDKDNIDLVVSDIKMPDMNGIEFLTIVKEKYPRVIRTVLSGFVDKSLVMKAFNNGIANTYFAKPWEESNLREGIARVLYVRKHLKNRHLLDLLSNVSKMPVLPEIYNQFMDAVKADADYTIIEKIISNDLIITSNILHIANSIFYSGEKTASLENAILRLGINAVRDLIITMSMCQDVSMDDYQKSQVFSVFQHSALVNKYYQKLHLALFQRKVDTNLSSIGITHDLGKIVLIIYFPDRYKKIVNNYADKKLPSFCASEMDLGLENCTHAELGAYLLDFWNFHTLSIEAALFHHLAENKKIVVDVHTSIIALINAMVNMLEINPDAESTDFDSDNALKCSKKIIDEIFDKLKTDYRNYCM